MDSTLIEKMDKSRYNIVKWLTIGWAVWFGGIIIRSYIHQQVLLGIILGAGAVGWTIFIISLIKHFNLQKKIKADPQLVRALADEWTQHNLKKSLEIGFWSFLFTTGLMFGLSQFTEITAKLVCQIILFVGILSALISSLVYNKA